MTQSPIEDLVRPQELGQVLAAATGDDRWLTPSAELIAGGKSNLTFILRSDAGELVLRRPPTGELLPSAHDMGREARVQQALAGSAVPVPQVVHFDPTGDLLGVPYYVMERVEGHTIRGELPEGYATTPEERHALGLRFAEVLAALHAVDYQAVGLGELGRPDGFLARQVKRWRGQWDASKDRDVPAVEELAELLAANVPDSPTPTLVHGDYRLDNCLFHPTDPSQMQAVLDWEMATLGDPLTDVGLLLFFWREEGESFTSITPGVSNLPGFPTRAEMAAAYEAASGRSMANIDFYLAFSHFKFAVIMQGIAARVKSGSMAGQDFGDLSGEIEKLAVDGLAVLRPAV